MDLQETTVRSAALKGTRSVWAEPANDAPTWLFLDGELYLERVGARDLLEDARGGGRLPPSRCVFVSHGGPMARHDDFTCRPAYGAFLRNELLPHLGVDAATERPLLVGLSLSALAAAFAVHSCGDVFPRAVCQSPSAWWREEWFLRHVEGTTAGGGRYYLSVGTEETESDVRHPPTNMFQGTSQLASVTHLAAGLEAHGNEVRFRTFAGGHDPRCWAEELVDAIAWALGAGTGPGGRRKRRPLS
ncbi:MAG: alpha/beta hydrolase [Planctomycetota bacterium]|jgi:enterochelin esterase family protein